MAHFPGAAPKEWGVRRPSGRRLLGRARPGQALMQALLLSIVISLLLVASINFTQNAKRASKDTSYDAQAYNVARAGLVDAISWFKRRAVQPVDKFRPFYNTAVPAKGDTNDPYLIDPGQAGGNLDPSDGGGNDDKPSLGIVQEYQIDDRTNLYARYEVGKITKLEIGNDGRLSKYSIMEKNGAGAWVAQTVPNARSTKWEGVQDVTDSYGIQGTGLIWRIRSHGYVYVRKPGAAAGTRFYQAPNEVLAQCELETEIRRLQVTDYNAAIHGNQRLTFNDNPRVKVVADGGYAVKYNVGATLSPGSAPSAFTSTQGNYKLVNDALDWFEVFGVSDAQTVASIADVTASGIADLPTAMSSMALTYIKPSTGTITFDNTHPLNGGGILVVDGNLNLAQGAASTFSGLVYVTGNYTQGSPSAITGEVVVKGNLTISAPSDIANVEYNSSVLDEVRRQLGQYRERRSGSRVVTPQ